MLHIIEEIESQVGDSFDRYLLGFEILVFKERKSEQKEIRVEDYPHYCSVR